VGVSHLIDPLRNNIRGEVENGLLFRGCDAGQRDVQPAVLWLLGRGGQLNFALGSHRSEAVGDAVIDQ
jgi:hypothetical protein